MNNVWGWACDATNVSGVRVPCFFWPCMAAVLFVVSAAHGGVRFQHMWVAARLAICKNSGQALSRPAKQQGLPALPHANPSVHSPQSTDSGDNDIGEPR